MAQYEAYIDESCNDDRNPLILVVGGYIFRSSETTIIDAAWKGVLDQFGIPLFHMKDVAPCNGIFKPLGMEKCDQLAGQIIELTKRHAPHY